MITKITFKALKQGKVVYKNLPIEHPNYDIIPSELFNGFEMPPVSIESQVIDYLDSIDKSDIMAKYDWDIILDYYPYKKKVRKNEIEEFIERVNEMRKAQRRYKLFRTIESKFHCEMLEREVDFLLGKYIKEYKIF